jgi:hypothetical protein
MIFESVAGDMLKTLGYERLIDEASRLSFSHQEITLFNVENEKRMSYASLHVDSSDLEKRRPQEELLMRILKQSV